jgi:hypothetical protein
MQHQSGSRRQTIYALVFAAILALAGISLVGGTVWADVVQDKLVFLPIINIEAGGTIPPR